LYGDSNREWDAYTSRQAESAFRTTDLGFDHYCPPVEIKLPMRRSKRVDDAVAAVLCVRHVEGEWDIISSILSVDSLVKFTAGARHPQCQMQRLKRYLIVSVRASSSRVRS
jgi:hypothetical protein